MTGTLVKVAQRDPSNHGRAGLFDPLVCAPVSVPDDEYHLHAGHAYTAHAVDLVMGVGDKLVVAFKTPPGPTLLHFQYQWGSAGGANTQLREGAVWTTATGAVVPISARNRDNAIPSKVLNNFAQPAFLASQQVVTNPTVTVSGVVIYADYAFEARNEATDGRGLEFILKADTAYTLTLTTTVAMNAGQLEASWIEHASA